MHTPFQVVRCEYVSMCVLIQHAFVSSLERTTSFWGQANIRWMSCIMPDPICAGRSHIEVVIAHATTATCINLVQDLLQGLHGCVPTSHSRHHLKRLPALRQVQTLLLHCQMLKSKVSSSNSC